MDMSLMYWDKKVKQGIKENYSLSRIKFLSFSENLYLFVCLCVSFELVTIKNDLKVNKNFKTSLKLKS